MRKTACVLLSALLCGGISLAAGYNLLRATFGTSPNVVQVMFAQLPPAGVYGVPENWSVRATSISGGIREQSPIRVSVSNLAFAIVELDLGGRFTPPLNLTTERVDIFFRVGNAPTVTMAQPQKVGLAKAFTSAKGKADADLYLAAAAIATRHAKPVYSIDMKLGHLFTLPKDKLGSLGFTSSLKADEGSEVDPDSIKVSATHQKIVPFKPSTGMILRSEFLGGEFERKTSTRNLISGVDATIFFPSKRLVKTCPPGASSCKETLTLISMELVSGLEGGRDFPRGPNPLPSKKILRGKLGANAYLNIYSLWNLHEISWTGEYKVRIPTTEEPFTGFINGTKTTLSTTKARHYVQTQLAFLFQSNYGVSLSYEYGSLPPGFKMLHHKVSAGLFVQFKQAR